MVDWRNTNVTAIRLCVVPIILQVTTTIQQYDSTSFLQLSTIIARYHGVLHSNNNDMILLQHPSLSLSIYLSLWSCTNNNYTWAKCVRTTRRTRQNTFKKQFFFYRNYLCTRTYVFKGKNSYNYRNVRCCGRLEI